MKAAVGGSDSRIGSPGIARSKRRLVEQKGFATQRPVQGQVSPNPCRRVGDPKGNLVDQLTQSSNTPRESNTLYAWLREVAAMRETA